MWKNRDDITKLKWYTNVVFCCMIDLDEKKMVKTFNS